MAKGTFGERLKRERELREVSLDEVSKGTKIARRFLEALENERWDQLPGGVFGRGFVRSAARFLGLSEENLLSEYDLARGESAGAPAKPEERIPSPPKWIPAAVALAVVVLLAVLAVGGRYAWKAYQSRRAQKKSSAVVGLPASVETQGAPPPVTTALPSPAANATLDLSLVAEKATRIRVVADSKLVFDAELPVGETPHFSAADHLEVTAADPSVVLLELNGQRVPLPSALGSSGTIVLTQKDVRQATGGDTQR